MAKASGRLPPATWLRAELLIVAVALTLVGCQGSASRAMTPTPARIALSSTSTWTTTPGYRGIEGIAVAPSNPQIAYQAMSSGTPARGPSGIILRRTANQGATWQTLTAPYISHAIYPIIGDVDVFVNPLDAHIIFLRIGAVMDDQTSACASNGGGSDGQCFFQYISTDGGDHWQALTLPLQGYLYKPQLNGGGLSGQRDSLNTSVSHLYAKIHPQGQRDDRLMRSDDGGMT